MARHSFIRVCACVCLCPQAMYVNCFMCVCVVYEHGSVLGAVYVCRLCECVFAVSVCNKYMEGCRADW